MIAYLSHDKELDKPYRERRNTKIVMNKLGVRPEIAWARLHKFYRNQITLEQVFAKVG